MNGQPKPVDPRVAGAFGQTQEQKAAEMTALIRIVLHDLGINPDDPSVHGSVHRSFERAARMGIVS